MHKEIDIQEVQYNHRRESAIEFSSGCNTYQPTAHCVIQFAGWPCWSCTLTSLLLPPLWSRNSPPRRFCETPVWDGACIYAHVWICALLKMMLAIVLVFVANDEKMVLGDRDQHSISPVKVLVRSIRRPNFLHGARHVSREMWSISFSQLFSMFWFIAAINVRSRQSINAILFIDTITFNCAY